MSFGSLWFNTLPAILKISIHENLVQYSGSYQFRADQVMNQAMSPKTHLRIVTYNIGGGRDEFDATTHGILTAMQHLSPDVLGIQECTEWIDADRARHNFCDRVEETLHLSQPSFFGKTLSLRENFSPKKSIMLTGVYQDWQDWAFGNALCSRYPFTRLGNPEVPGTPQNLSIFKPQVYEGTRDTDPRCAIIGRLKCQDFSPFIVCTHFSTLVGERGGKAKEIPGKFDEAQALRFQQARRLMELLKPRLAQRQAIILMGDFNAGPKEACISAVIEGEGGFVRLVPRSETPTHPKVPLPVDHIFVFPADLVEDYTCWVDDSTVSRRASDHLPVAADLVFK